MLLDVGGRDNVSRVTSRLVTVYKTSSDRERRDVVAFIEDEARAGWPTLAPSTGTPEDLKAFGALRKLMTERRDARVDPNLRDVRAHLATVTDIVPTLIVRAASGRVM
jgi:hypothetical protein